MKLTCQCCGIEREFRDGEHAFISGWDAPPRFTQHVSCDLCPAVCIVMGKSHAKAHAYWAEHGRPNEFNHFCDIDENFGDLDQWNKFIEFKKFWKQQFQTEKGDQ